MQLCPHFERFKRLRRSLVKEVAVISFTGLTEEEAKRLRDHYVTEITSFSGDFAFLSNFFPTSVSFEDRWYPTIEHAFQAAKTLDGDQRLVIERSSSPGQAKKLGKKLILRKDWEIVKDSIMLELLRTKFTDAGLREKLVQTGTKKLIEGNQWGDRIWGAVWNSTTKKWEGQNKLGQLLEQVRSEINSAEVKNKNDNVLR